VLIRKCFDADLRDLPPAMIAPQHNPRRTSAQAIDVRASATDRRSGPRRSIRLGLDAVSAGSRQYP
jgi:hypothetical protein